jgi:GDP-4-dehydro-6-deoxy-D-mannose reductase
MTADSAMPARALVTGASGFLGRQLVATLVERGWFVCGSSRRPRPESIQVHQWVSGDLLTPGFADRLVRRSRPTNVFHLAGTLGQRSGQLPQLIEIHVLGTAALLEAVATQQPGAWVAVASSSAVYGGGESQPIPETARMMPLTDYASSKAAAEMVVTQVRLATGLTSCILRLFNLVGPGQSETLLLPSLARQVAEQELGGPGVLKVGNLEPKRDYLDARDASRAIAELASARCVDPVVNIGSGRSWSVQNCLDTLLGLSTRGLSTEIDPNLVRSVDVREQRADVSLLQRITKWHPTIELTTSISDLLDEWRARISVGSRA